MDTIQEIQPGFFHVWNLQLLRNDQYELPELLQQFRDHLRTQKPQVANPRGKHSAFSTNFQGKDQDQPNQPPRACICGQTHWFSQCLYIVKSLRKQTWKGDSVIQKKVDDKIATDPRTKAQIKKVLARIEA